MLKQLNRTACFAMSILLVAGALRAQETTKPDPAFGEWITLFDGTSLEGWGPSKPEGRTMTWTIEDGAMTNDVTSIFTKHNIAATRKFHNFEAHVEFKIAPGGNSGVYMRGRAEIQVFDSHGKPELGISDMGALYKYKAPIADATKPAGEWNTLDIRFIGTRVSAWLNGTLIQDNAYIPHKTGAGRTDEFDSPGIFELQGDHDKVWYRNIKIRPLFEADGWTQIFNRKDSTGWIGLDGNPSKWTVEEDAITNAGFPIKDLLTENKFGDFLVHYEYKSEGNSGFYLRNLWEIQIENSHGLEPGKHTDGALYDFFPPLVNMSRPKGEWSVVQAKVVGRKITVFHNGALVHDGRECKARTYNKFNALGLDDPGPFLIQGDHGRVWFTNIWVKPLN